MARRGMKPGTGLNIVLGAIAATLGGWLAFAATDRTSNAGAVVGEPMTYASADDQLPPIPTVVLPIAMGADARADTFATGPAPRLARGSSEPQVRSVPVQPGRPVRTRSSR